MISRIILSMNLSNDMSNEIKRQRDVLDVDPKNYNVYKYYYNSSGRRGRNTSQRLNSKLFSESFFKISLLYIKMVDITGDLLIALSSIVCTGVGSILLFRKYFRKN
jgi:hypothetical protein